MSIFKFKEFNIHQEQSAHKVGTDAMLLGALIQPENAHSALDIGTGTGVISLMLAQKSKKIQIQAIEIEEGAFHEAKKNVALSKFSHQIEVIHGDFLSYNLYKTFDLIFSNPPYFLTTNLNKDEKKSLARHALSLKPDLLFKKIEQLLTIDGCCYFILPCESVTFYESAATKNQLFLKEKIDVYAKTGKLVRNILCFSKQTVDLKCFNICIRNEDNSYSEEYITLTKAYHFKDLNIF